MAAFNCYACHERDKTGGPEQALSPFFKTVQPEMGEEGRMPPSLTGVGGKLNPAYLRQVLADGAKDRPYMYTHMPGFGDANVGPLVAAFEAADAATPAPRVTFHEPVGRVKGTARTLVGATSLGCIKCHRFAGHQAEGIQAIDLTVMPKRLRRGWFHRYLLNPQAIRPGTRMPAAWPDRKTFYTDILDGDTTKQIEAIWLYLSDGAQAQVPAGMNPQFIPLTPTDEAIVYRNFIAGAGPRAIGVGYPEKAHLAFDANNLRLAMVWQGAFIDAARHWTDRGEGFEPPLGDNVLHLAEGVSFAVLANTKEAWPTKGAREMGYRFRGYRLTRDQRPTFRYTCGDVTVEDFPNAVAAKGRGGPTIRRELTLTAAKPVDNLWFRAAVANRIEPLGKGWFKIDGEWKMHIESAARPRVRQSGGKAELVVPVRFDGGRARLVQTFAW
jgi:hypothetical protein